MGYLCISSILHSFNIISFILDALSIVILAPLFQYIANVYLKHRNKTWRFIYLLDSFFGWVEGGLYGIYIFLVSTFGIIDFNIAHIFWGISYGGFFGAIFFSVLNSTCNKNTYKKCMNLSFLELFIIGAYMGFFLDCTICYTFNAFPLIFPLLLTLGPLTIIYFIILKIFFVLYFNNLNV